ncbi:hypothetical protein EHQ58_07940 [Leptospira ognonensis]|uniref:Uncharacterized protein n=1 Tax=Leptospira ognonensis TaxID=2484945 RepID=A0A4R9K5V5_9LEPT|nr:hypothetical protein [Leptospira ognonensis]TGL59667.1 hypothetical protein EHQ58_07940 [Leptospira ognonensis]
MRYLKIITLVLILIVISFSTLVPTPNEHVLKEIPKQKLVGKLKGIAFATIRTSIIKEYAFTEPKEIRYVPCSPDFPVLLGDFPCSLLNWDEEAVYVEETNTIVDAESSATEPNPDDLLGGKVIVLLSKTKSPNFNGSVVKLGDDEDMLRLFYDKEGYLSHYTFQTYVTVFKWKAVENTRTLLGVLTLKLDSNHFPIAGKEIEF